MQRFNVGPQLLRMFKVAGQVVGVLFKYPVLAEELLLFGKQALMLNVQRISHVELTLPPRRRSCRWATPNGLSEVSSGEFDHDKRSPRSMAGGVRREYRIVR
jgi:hypothetical protein